MTWKELETRKNVQKIKSNNFTTSHIKYTCIVIIFITFISCFMFLTKRVAKKGNESSNRCHWWVCGTMSSYTPFTFVSALHHTNLGLITAYKIMFGLIKNSTDSFYTLSKIQNNKRARRLFTCQTDQEFHGTVCVTVLHINRTLFVFFFVTVYLFEKKSCIIGPFLIVLYLDVWNKIDTLIRDHCSN